MCGSNGAHAWNIRRNPSIFLAVSSAINSCNLSSVDSVLFKLRVKLLNVSNETPPDRAVSPAFK